MQDRLQIVVVGAGPYGLSIAAHLRAAGMRFRIFGAPMSTWREQMPAGMYLKSDGFASNLSEPTGSFTIKHFCRRSGIPYDDTKIPVRLETFTAYGLEFQRRFVPELEDRQVEVVRRNGNGFRMTLSGGESVEAERVVLAVGITHFHHVPATLDRLPARLVTHSSAHSDLTDFRGRKVAVIGGGASAIDLSALLHEAGADVSLVARQPALHFHNPPESAPAPFWKKLRHPQSGIGPGLRSRFYTDAPLLFRRLPRELRVNIVRTHLRPAAGWPMRDRVLGKFPLILSHSVEGADAQNGGVRLNLRAQDGAEAHLCVEHVIAATGYRPDLERLAFLDPELRTKIVTVEKTPMLSSHFESSVPGLYFVGLCAANTFGPMFRFAYGSDFTARHLIKHLVKAAK